MLIDNITLLFFYLNKLKNSFREFRKALIRIIKRKLNLIIIGFRSFLNFPNVLTGYVVFGDWREFTKRKAKLSWGIFQFQIKSTYRLIYASCHSSWILESSLEYFGYVLNLLFLWKCSLRIYDLKLNIILIILLYQYLRNLYLIGAQYRCLNSTASSHAVLRI